MVAPAETLVNTVTMYSQGNPRLALLADGGWIIAYNAERLDGDNMAIAYQRFSADGTPVDGEVLVNDYATSTQFMPDVTALSDGGWVISWESYGQDGNGYSIVTQRYDSDGVEVDIETVANSETSGWQSGGAVTALANGAYVVAWRSPGDGDSNGIFMRIFDSANDPTSTDIQVNSAITGSQSAARVTALADGTFVVAYESSAYGNGVDIVQRHFAANGTALDSEMVVNSSVAGDQEDLDIAALGNGGWVVTW